MRLVVTAVVRNVADRLDPWFDTAQQVLRSSQRGLLLVTDDASTDGTADKLEAYGASVRRSVPLFARDEVGAYEQHYAWLSSHLDATSWVLYLHPDESLTAPRRVTEQARIAAATGRTAVEFPVLSSWEEGSVRTDGFWGSRSAVRMFRWEPVPGMLPGSVNISPVPAFVRHAAVMRTDACALVDLRMQGLKRRRTEYDRLKSLLDPGLPFDVVESVLDSSPKLQAYDVQGDAPSRALKVVS